MKNAKKLVLAALMVTVMAFALCACGSNPDGTYVVDQVNGESIDTALQQMKDLGMEMTSEEFCTFKLEGKNLTITLMGQSKTGTFELDGENLKMTVDGTTGSATYKDGVITFTNGDQVMTMKRK